MEQDATMCITSKKTTCGIHTANIKKTYVKCAQPARV